MSKAYQVTDEKGIVVITFLKPPTTNEYCDAINDVAALESSIQYRLWILNHGYDPFVAIEQLAVYALMVFEGIPAKVGMVAPDDHTFGLCRMQGGIRKDPDVDFRVFRTKEEALKWMGE